MPALGGRTANGGRGALGSGGATQAGRAGAGGAGAMNGGASGTGGASDASVCPRYDASHPPAMLALSGNLGTHDPALLAEDGKYYLFQTGRGLPTKTSSDLAAWQGGSAVFSSNPSWIASAVPAATDLWAPDISSFGGSYHLYYAASSFGKNTSCIGHATRASLASGAWADHGSVLCSGSGDDFNAIDPNVVVDEAGTPWLAFGSFWSGIQIVELDATGAVGDNEPKFIASRPSAGGALEGAFIARACGYYYLFTSWDHCCDSPWNYNIRVGRSTSAGGPYADKSGKALLDGGGTELVAGNGTWTAPGHNAVIFTPNGAYNVYHALDASHANPTLRVAELVWDADGWPVSAGP
jgi:arabinan endo-1,5-alpha-L-arabinosidase